MLQQFQLQRDRKTGQAEVAAAGLDHRRAADIRLNPRVGAEDGRAIHRHSNSLSYVTGSGKWPDQSAQAHRIAVTEPSAPATSPIVRGPAYCEATPAAAIERIM